MDGTTSQDKSLVKPGHKLAYATAQNSPHVPGRREFFKYRDLGETRTATGVTTSRTSSAQ